MWSDSPSQGYKKDTKGLFVLESTIDPIIYPMYSFTWILGVLRDSQSACLIQYLSPRMLPQYALGLSVTSGSVVSTPN